MLTQMWSRQFAPIQAQEFTMIISRFVIERPGPKTCCGIVKPSRSEYRRNFTLRQRRAG
jgi:hypothetical protein